MRSLLILERDLRLLAEPKDEVDSNLIVKEISSQELKRITALRQKIRVAEISRISTAMKANKDLYHDQSVAKKIGKMERDLDRFFNRNANKMLRDLAKSRRDLIKEKNSSRRNEGEVEKLNKRQQSLNEQISKIHLLIYGYAEKVGFEEKADTTDSSEAGKLLVKWVDERNQLLKTLRGGVKWGAEGEGKGGLAGGLFVYSTNLGVVLDTSGSMSPHIEGLKKEIKKTFSEPHYREIVGCRLSGTYYSESNFMLPNRSRETLSEIEELIVVYKVDTIYWFCDLRDAIDQTGLRRLRDLLKRSGAKLLVKSMSESPDRDLKPLISEFKN